MKIVGGWLIALGAIIAFGAFFYPTTVETFSSERVVNLGQLQIQMLILICGLAVFLAGVILTSMGIASERAIRIFVESLPAKTDFADLIDDAKPLPWERLNAHAMTRYGIHRRENQYWLGDAGYPSLADAILSARNSSRVI